MVGGAGQKRRSGHLNAGSPTPESALFTQRVSVGQQERQTLSKLLCSPPDSLSEKSKNLFQGQSRVKPCARCCGKANTGHCCQIS